MTIEKTDWFPGHVKPVRVGVYERDYGYLTYVYCKWDGWCWMCQRGSIDAANAVTMPSPRQGSSWRGLASDPNGDKV